jgi:hypothetical protein
VQLLHTAVAAAAAGAAQQAGEAAVQAQQLQQMRADLTVAAAGRETAERQVQEMQGQLKLLQQQSDALRSELHVVSPTLPISSTPLSLAGSCRVMWFVVHPYLFALPANLSLKCPARVRMSQKRC